MALLVLLAIGSLILLSARFLCPVRSGGRGS
jgi:hypothetical protein